jgi:hypothetical protein
MKQLALLICALLTPAMTVAVGPPPECLTTKYSRYAKAQETWQREVTKLLVEVAPRYEEVAQLYLTDQLRAIEQAKRAVEFLARQEPDKLRTQMSLNNWLSLEETDRQRIAASDERYAELLALRTAARKRPPHPDGDGLREVMRSEVMPSDTYKELLQAYLRSVQAAENMQCQ